MALDVVPEITQVKIEAIRGTTVIDLTDYLLRQIVAFDGFGMAESARLTERGPYQHGVTDRGFRLQPRTMHIALQVHGSDYASMLDLREAMMAVFRPGDDPVEIRYSAPQSRMRSIYAYVTRGLEGATRDMLAFRQAEVIQLLAPDPTWFETSESQASLSLAGGGSGMSVPVVVPFSVGGSIGAGTVMVPLIDGNAWDTYPIIALYGGMTGPKITNTKTGDVLNFSGYTIGNTDVWTVDCRYGRKSVLDQAGGSHIAALTADSDLATFRFVPGENSIAIEASGTNDTARVVFVYNRRYIGV